MRRWRVKCVKAHELPYGHELQNRVLHGGKGMIEKTRKKQGVKALLFL